MPCVVTAGGADPDAGRRSIGGCGSYGIAFLFERDPRGVAAGLGLRAGDADAAQVDQRQVGVGAAADRPHALGRQAVGERLGVGDDLAWRSAWYSGVAASLSATALAATACISGPPWMNGKTALSIARGVLLLADDHAAARAAQDLVRREA